MNILSLFDGMSGGQIAANRAGINVEKYYASEVDKSAITVTQANYPNTIQLGDITWREWNIDWSNIDLIMGGSPCQGFSFAGKRGGTQVTIDGEDSIIETREQYDLALVKKQEGSEVIFKSQSYLFWEYILILDHVKHFNPNVKFLLENVKMTQNNMGMITRALGVNPVFINSALVSAQNRQRYYWANWAFDIPEDKGIFLADIVQPPEDIPENMYYGEKSILYMDRGNDKWVQAGKRRADKYTQSVDKEKAFTVIANYHKGVPYNYFAEVYCGSMRGRYIVDGKRQDGKMRTAGLTKQRIEVQHDKKTNALTTVCKDNNVVYGAGEDKKNYEPESILYRKLTPIECERLQTIPDDYTAHVSNTQRYKMIGNGWTIDVIAHILKFISW